jgi:ubiquinone/menaquinone biosynthesis C-methylase UbiE
MIENVKQQEIVYDELYAMEQISYYDFHITSNRLTRFLRDRRLFKAITVLKKHQYDILDWNVLIVCGGVGGEGLFFIKNGFKDVTVSDISENSLRICQIFDPSIKTLKLNGENLDLPDNSYDLVVVQDGLHHLPRPATGFTEMLRVAKKAIIVIEPYDSLIGNLVGTEWENTGGAINYVYRWNRSMVNQTVKSFLLKNYKKITVLRFWDHSLAVNKLSHKFPEPFRPKLAKLIYSLLRPLDSLGNMMVAVIQK